MHAAEAAVAHHQDLIARARRVNYGFDERVEIVEGLRLAAERRQRFAKVPA
jgi:hypothetical protein